mgnify:CR=1 FL=1
MLLSTDIRNGIANANQAYANARNNANSIGAQKDYLANVTDACEFDEEVENAYSSLQEEAFAMKDYDGADKTEKWESDVRSAIASEEFTNYSTEIFDKVSEKIEKSEFIINMFVKTSEKALTANAAYYASSASSS